jgi:pimeloyl-ACP methyl ester carboxylesterase
MNSNVNWSSAFNNRIPIKTKPPRLGQAIADWNGRTFSMPFVHREGTGGPAVLFVHGLGGAKENFHAAFQSPGLADCTLLSFDLPGTGLAAFDEKAALDVSALADITQVVASQLLPDRHFVAGASMGGLIALLLFGRYGLAQIMGLINLEGNLCPEDCMFSRRVVAHDFESFAPVFEQIMGELRSSRYAGDQMVAHNMALNVDIRAYYRYSFETVHKSASTGLLEQFIALPIPRLFLYGEANKRLSYLPKLRGSPVEVREIPASAHFFFYDNPVDTFQAIGEFVHAHQTNAEPKH